MTVRKIRPEDKTGWLRLFRAYINFYQATVPEDVVQLTWDRVLKEEDGLCGLIALDSANSPRGIATLVFHRSTWSPTWYCYLEDLFVDPLMRRLGIGRALIEATYAEADARGATRTYWVTRTDNGDARRLYDQLANAAGFVMYRR